MSTDAGTCPVCSKPMSWGHSPIQGPLPYPYCTHCIQKTFEEHKIEVHYPTQADRDMLGLKNLHHNLKTWPEFFEAIRTGRKTFDARFNDRGFQEGDTLTLQEWNPETPGFTKREINGVITYVLHGGQFGIQEGWVVLGLALLKTTEEPLENPPADSGKNLQG